MPNNRATIVSGSKNGKMKTPWLDNAMKSVGGLVKDSIKEIAPNVSEGSETIVNSTKAVIDTIRTAKNSNTRLSTVLKRNKYVKMFDESVKTALNDLKTGNLYNQDRFANAMAGIDENNDNDGTTFGDDGAGAPQQSSDPHVNAMIKVSDQIAAGTEAQIKLQKASMDAMIAMNATSMQQNQHHVSQILNSLGNINNNLAALVQYQNENMNKFINASMAYYEATGAAITKKDEKKSDKVTVNDILKSENGGLDFSTYKKYVKQQFKDSLEKTELGAILPFLQDEKMIKAMFADPLGAAGKIIMPNLIPKVMATTFKNIDDTFSAFVPAMLTKIGTLAETTGNSLMDNIKRVIGNTFGITNIDSKKFKKTQVERGAIPFDGETKHAITEVITKELRDQTGYLQIIAEHYKADAKQHVRKNGEIWSYKDSAYYKQGDIDKRIARELNETVQKTFASSKFGESMFGLANSANTKEAQNELTSIIRELLYKSARSKEPLSIDQLIKLLQECAGNTAAKNMIKKYMKDMYKNDQGTFRTADISRHLAIRNQNKRIEEMMNDSDWRINYSSFAEEDANGNFVDPMAHTEQIIFSDRHNTRARNLKNKRFKYNRDQYNNIKTKIEADRKFNVNNYGAWYERFGLDKTKVGKMFEESMQKMGASVTGMMNGFMNRDARAVLEEFGNGMKEIGSKAKRFFFGEKDEDSGEYKNGAFSELINNTKKEFLNVFSTIKDGAMAKLFGKKKDENGRYIDDESLHGGVFGTIANAFKEGSNGWLDHFFGTESDKDRAEAREKISEYLKKAAPTAAVGAAAGAGLSMSVGGSVLGMFVGGPLIGAGLGAAVGLMSKSKGFQDFLFGKEVEQTDEEGNVTKTRLGGLISKRVQDWFKENKDFAVGSAAVGGVTGAITGGGLLGTLVGGPIAGAMLGLAGAVVSKSGVFNKFLFGDGEQKGLINGVKDAWAKAMGNKNGENASLFNDGVKSLGMMATGTAAGGLLGTLMGGPVVGAIAGLALSIKGQSTNLKEWFFGKEDGLSYLDENGDVKTAKKQGVLGVIGNAIKANVIEPMKTELVYVGKDFLSTLQHKILTPIGLIGEYVAGKAGAIVHDLSEGVKGVVGSVGNVIGGAAKALLNPVTEAVGDIAKTVTDATWKFSKAVLKTPGMLIESFLGAAGIKEWFNELKPVKFIKNLGATILTTVKSGINGLFHMIGTIVAAPFKLLGNAVKGTINILGDIGKSVGNTVGHVADKLGFGEAVQNFRYKWATRDFQSSKEVDENGNPVYSLFDRMRLNKLRYAEHQKEIKANREANKVHDKNIKLIQKGTKGQFAEDTNEARMYLKKINPSLYARLEGKSIDDESREVGKIWDKIDSVPENTMSPEMISAKYSKMLYEFFAGEKGIGKRIFGGKSKGKNTEINDKVRDIWKNASHDEIIDGLIERDIKFNHGANADDEELRDLLMKYDSGVAVKKNNLISRGWGALQDGLIRKVGNIWKGKGGRGRKRLGGRGLFGNIGNFLMNKALPSIGNAIGKGIKSVGSGLSSSFDFNFGNAAKGAAAALGTGLLASMLLKSGGKKNPSSGLPIGSSNSDGLLSTSGSTSGVYGSNDESEESQARDEERLEKLDADIDSSRAEVASARGAKEASKALAKENKLRDQQNRDKSLDALEKAKSNSKNSYEVEAEIRARKEAIKAEKDRAEQIQATRANAEATNAFREEWGKTFSIKDGLITGALIAALPAILKLLGGFFGGFSGGTGGNDFDFDNPFPGLALGTNRDAWNNKMRTGTNGRSGFEELLNGAKQILTGNPFLLDVNGNVTRGTDTAGRTIFRMLAETFAGNVRSPFYMGNILSGAWNGFKNLGKGKLWTEFSEAFTKKHPILGTIGKIPGKLRDGVVAGVEKVRAIPGNVASNWANIAGVSQADMWNQSARALTKADLADDSVQKILVDFGDDAVKRTRGHGLFIDENMFKAIEEKYGKEEAERLTKNMSIASVTKEDTIFGKMGKKFSNRFGTKAASSADELAEGAAKMMTATSDDIIKAATTNPEMAKKFTEKGYKLASDGTWRYKGKFVRNSDLLETLGKDNVDDISKALVGSVDDLTEDIVKAQNGASKGLLKDLLGHIDEGFKLVAEKLKIDPKKLNIPKMMGKFLKEKWDDLCVKISEEVLPKLGIRVGADVVSSGIVEAVFITVSAIEGVDGTAKLFHINRKDVDGTMRLISGAIGALKGTTPGMVIDIIIEILGAAVNHDFLYEFAVELYKLLKGEESEAYKNLNVNSAKFEKEWDDNRKAEMKPQYEALKANGMIDSNLSFDDYYQKVLNREMDAVYTGFEDYNAQQNATLMDKAFQGIGKGFKWVGDQWKKGWQTVWGGKEVLSDDNGNTYEKNSDGSYKMTKADGTTVNIAASALNKTLKSTKNTGWMGQLFGRDAEVVRYRNADGTYSDSKLGNMGAAFMDGLTSNGMSDQQLLRMDPSALTDSARQVQTLIDIRDGIFQIVGGSEDGLFYDSNTGEYYDDDWEDYEEVEYGMGGRGRRRRRRRRLGRGGRGLWRQLRSGRGRRRGGRGYKEETLNGASYFDQEDPLRRNEAYGSDGATMGDSGCGPTTMAMAVNTAMARGGRGVTPEMMAGMAETMGYRDSTGTNADYISASANAMGMNSDEVVMPDSGDLYSQLSSGNPVVLLGHTGRGGRGRRRGGKGNVPYTSDGHYVLATGLDNDGNVMINDPRGKEFSGSYDINDVANMTDSSWSISDGGFGRGVRFKHGRGGRGNDVEKWLNICKAVKQAFASSGSEYHADNSHDITITVGNMTIKARPDCSGFVSACLVFYGVVGSSVKLSSSALANGNNSTMLGAGFTPREFTSWSDCQPGDILARNGHTCIFAGMNNGAPYVFNAGSTRAIQNSNATPNGPKTYTMIWSPGNAGVKSVGNYDVKGNTKSVNENRVPKNYKNKSTGPVDITFSEEQTPAADDTFFGKLGRAITKAYSGALDNAVKATTGKGGRGRRRLGGRGDGYDWKFAVNDDNITATSPKYDGTYTFPNKTGNGVIFHSAEAVENYAIDQSKNHSFKSTADLDELNRTFDSIETKTLGKEGTYEPKESYSGAEMAAGIVAAPVVAAAGAVSDSANFWSDVYTVKDYQYYTWDAVQLNNGNYGIYDKSGTTNEYVSVPANGRSLSEIKRLLNNRTGNERADIVKAMGPGALPLTLTPELKKHVESMTVPTTDPVEEAQKLKEQQRAEAKAQKYKGYHNWVAVELKNGKFAIYDTFGTSKKEFIITSNRKLDSLSAVKKLLQSRRGDSENDIKNLFKSKTIKMTSLNLNTNLRKKLEDSIVDKEKDAKIAAEEQKKKKEKRDLDRANLAAKKQQEIGSQWTAVQLKSGNYAIYDKGQKSKKVFYIDKSQFKSASEVQRYLSAGAADYIASDTPISEQVIEDIFGSKITRRDNNGFNEDNIFDKKKVETKWVVDRYGNQWIVRDKSGIYKDTFIIKGHNIKKGSKIEALINEVEPVPNEKQKIVITPEQVMTALKNAKTLDSAADSIQKFNTLPSSMEKALNQIGKAKYNDKLPHYKATMLTSGDYLIKDENGIYKEYIKIPKTSYDSLDALKKDMPDKPEQHSIADIYGRYKKKGGTYLPSHLRKYADQMFYTEGSSTTFADRDHMKNTGVDHAYENAIVDKVTGKNTHDHPHWFSKAEQYDGNPTFYIEDSNGYYDAKFRVINKDAYGNKMFDNAVQLDYTFKERTNNENILNEATPEYMRNLIRNYFGDFTENAARAEIIQDSTLGEQSQKEITTEGKSYSVYYDVFGNYYKANSDGSYTYYDLSNNSTRSADKQTVMRLMSQGRAANYAYTDGSNIYLEPYGSKGGQYTYVYDKQGRFVKKLDRNTVNEMHRSGQIRKYQGNKKVESRVSYATAAPEKIKEEKEFKLNNAKSATTKATGNSSWISVVRYVKNELAKRAGSQDSNAMEGDSRYSNSNGKGGRGIRRLGGRAGTTQEDVKKSNESKFDKASADKMILSYNGKETAYDNSKGNIAFISAAIDLYSGNSKGGQPSSSAYKTENTSEGLGEYGFNAVKWNGWDTLVEGDILVDSSGGHACVFAYSKGNKNMIYTCDGNNISKPGTTESSISEYKFVWRTKGSGKASIDTSGTSKGSAISSMVNPSGNFGSMSDKSGNQSSSSSDGGDTSSGSPAGSADSGMSLWERLIGYIGGFFSGAVNAFGEKLATGKSSNKWYKDLLAQYVPGYANDAAGEFSEGSSSKGSATINSESGESNGEGSFDSIEAANINPNDAMGSAWKYLRAKGLSKNATAGLMGNLQAESGFKTNNLQNSFEGRLGNDDEYTRKVDSGEYSGEQFAGDSAGYGLAQWTSAGRKQGLYNLAKNSGTSIADTKTQLDHLWSELSGGYNTSVLTPLSNPDIPLADASNIVLTKFERPKDQSSKVQGYRQSLAKGIYQQYAGNDSGSDGGSVNTGKNNDLLEGRTPQTWEEAINIYKDYQQAYGDNDPRTQQAKQLADQLGSQQGGLGGRGNAMSKLKRMNKRGGRGTRIGTRNVFLGGRAGNNPYEKQDSSNTSILRKNRTSGDIKVNASVPSSNEFIQVGSSSTDRELIYNMISVLSSIATSNIDSAKKLAYLKDIYDVLGPSTKEGTIAAGIIKQSTSLDNLSKLTDKKAGASATGKDKESSGSSKKSESSTGKGGRGFKDWEPTYYPHRDKIDPSGNLHNSLFGDTSSTEALARRIASGSGM